MGVVKDYFKEECQPRNLGVEHLCPSDFYLSVWQKNRSATPLFVLRTVLFLAALGIVLASMSLYIIDGIYQFWFIYLTHWGLILITLATGFGAGVSARCFFYGPLNRTRLPWYVRTYWLLYNVAVPVAFLITVFYWTVLYPRSIAEELNQGLDVAVHALNTIIMLLLLVTSSQPSRLLHLYQPVSFALLYFLFGLIYYLAGGTNPSGQPYIYSVINWSYPGTTFGIGVATGLLLILLYLVKVAIAKGRDAASGKWVKPEPVTSEGHPLRQTEPPV